ncbi:MAG: CpcT/CpeT family chromophore lyase [Steroidobacteraceae bacterium]
MSWRGRWLAGCAGLLWLGPATAGELLDRFMALQVGEFDSSRQARLDTRYQVARWHIVEIWADRPDPERWVYVESWMEGGERPYLQRIASFVEDGADGAVIRSTRYRLTEPSNWVGAWREPGRFAGLARDALEAVPGCGVAFTRTGLDRFEGGTSGSACANDYRGATYAVSTTVLDESGLDNWDRGFDQQGRQVWGPAERGYRLLRLRADAASACEDPVRLLVWGSITNRERFGAYVGALARSGLYTENGGFYEARTPALTVLEGEPPPGRAVLIAQFPCREAVERFWRDPRYDEIRKLREGIAEFEVMVLPSVPYRP